MYDNRDEGPFFSSPRANGRGTADPSDWLAIPIALAIIAAMGFSAWWASDRLLETLSRQFATGGMREAALAAVVTVFIAGIAYYVREIRRWLIYPTIEVGIGVMMAILSVKPNLPPLVNVLAVIGAVRVTIEGIKRFRDFRAEARKRAEQEASAQGSGAEAALPNRLPEPA
ncbi:hypothetical protein EOA33_31485 [Mesorhizobium sp. M4A.F.Ca.ET.050.02.1.1]|uniref:hypothetical protein n=1 Tax=Mesorhizobium sp. M4A.F.Ca.ET.050.02.1.1 TaxID=2496754 RepID=UPI000FCA869D|nr:hypothetical protein [Mesorhizobium sp. M4A.F.Ca.ET.050.02.1.1]RUX42596.1 hypothetical protein EOA33_31485 [Mesorhizobium sp. M4A.F.Ca.ET.050.02.1.1]